MQQHTNPVKRLYKLLSKGRAKAFNSGEEFYLAFEQAIKRTQEDIETYYMQLPLDADGVPIHIGDTLEYINGTEQGEVQTLSDCWVNFGGAASYGVKSCRHVKQDTVGSVLMEYARDVLYTTSHNQFAESPDDIKFPDLIKYVERIRKAVDNG